MAKMITAVLTRPCLFGVQLCSVSSASQEAESCRGVLVPTRYIMPRETSQTALSTDCPFPPGEKVPSTGVYEICHREGSRARVVLQRDEVFPHCATCCDDHVRYKLLCAAPHISEDPDFEELRSSADNSVLSTISPIPITPSLQSGQGDVFERRAEEIQAGRTRRDSRDL